MSFKTVKKTFIILSVMFLLMIPSVYASGSSESSSGNTYSTSDVKKAQKIVWVKMDGNGNVTREEAASTSNATPPLDAIAVEYQDSNGKVLKTVYYETDEVWVSAWITNIANAIDQVTFRISLAIHPFPNVMFSLYDLSAATTDSDFIALTMYPRNSDMTEFSSDKLLISNNFYKKGRTFQTINGYEFKQGGLPITEYQDSKGTGSTSLQYGKWSIVTLLFVSCFVAEILYTAIIGYVTGTSEEGGASLLKNIVKKCAITLLLFILVSALPFLLEAFRYGLFSVAWTFYGQAAQNYQDYYSNLGYSTANIIKENTVTNIFQLPGFFMQSMKDFFVKTGSSPVQKSLSSTMTKSSGDKSLQSLVVWLVTWIIVMIFRFFMFFMVLKATIHIARNVLEIYVLLGLVMILTPFAVFTPTKTMGSKCIMSLVSNVIECFIILTVILTIIPAVKAATISILDYTNTMTRMGVYKWEKNYGDRNPYRGEGMENKPEYYTHRLTFIAGKGFIMSVCDIYIKGERIAFLYAPSYPQGNEEIKQVMKTEGVTWTVSLSQTSGPDEISSELVKVQQFGGADSGIQYDSVKGSLVEKTKADEGYSVFNNGNGITTFVKIFANVLDMAGYYEDKDLMDNITYPVETKLADFVNHFRKNYIDSVPGSQILRSELHAMLSCNSMATRLDGGSTSAAYDDEYVAGLSPVDGGDVSPYTVSSYDLSTATAFTQFTLVFMGMFIPCFFVQQSTQITNSLMNGTAGMESLANAMSDVVGRTAKGVGGVVSGVGNVIRAINGTRSAMSQSSATRAAQQTAENTTALLNMLRPNSGGGGSGGNEARN